MFQLNFTWNSPGNFEQLNNATLQCTEIATSFCHFSVHKESEGGPQLVEQEEDTAVDGFNSL